MISVQVSRYDKEERQGTLPITDVLIYGTAHIPFRTVTSERATLEIGVDPDGSVLVKAPAHVPYTDVRRRVEQKARWIERQRAFFRSMPHVAAPRYENGATVRYLGRGYRLRIAAGPHRTALVGPYLSVHAPGGADAPAAIARAVDRWYRRQAKRKLAERLTVCTRELAHLNVAEPPMKLRRMARRWGSFTPSGTVHLHPDLIRAPVSCIDYVVTHELCHAVHPDHSPAFYALLTRVLTDWKQRRDRLNGTAW